MAKIRAIEVADVGGEPVEVELAENERILSVEAVLDGGYATNWTRVFVEVTA